MHFEKYINFFIIFSSSTHNNFLFWTSFDKTFEIIRFFENMIKVRQYPTTTTTTTAATTTTTSKKSLFCKYLLAFKNILYSASGQVGLLDFRFTKTFNCTIIELKSLDFLSCRTFRCICLTFSVCSFLVGKIKI